LIARSEPTRVRLNCIHKTYKEITMKLTGAAVLIGALIGLLISFSMDVTVSSSFDGSRVVNFGLVAQRNSIQMVSGFAALCGIVMLIFGGRKSHASDDLGDRVPCPACAEPILRAANICKHCHTEIALTKDTEEQEASAGLAESSMEVPAGGGKTELYFVVGAVVVGIIVALAFLSGLS
jgi:hypothetical protein